MCRDSKSTLLLPDSGGCSTRLPPRPSPPAPSPWAAVSFNSVAGTINTLTARHRSDHASMPTPSMSAPVAATSARSSYGQAGRRSQHPRCGWRQPRHRHQRRQPAVATTATTEATTNNLVDFSGHDADILVTSLNVGNQARVGNSDLRVQVWRRVMPRSPASSTPPTSTSASAPARDNHHERPYTNRVNLSGGTVTFGDVGATGTGVDIGNSTFDSGAGAASTIGELNISGGGDVTIHNGSGWLRRPPGHAMWRPAAAP